LRAVSSGGVKKHIFMPSNRVIYTVVGKSGDEFVDPQKPFCSCSNFFFRVLGGSEELCYHLLSYRIARESKKFDTVVFSDDEYSSLLKAIMRDVLTNAGERQDN
jgi:predicted nucleic acid-binding Zn finger protein